MPRQRDVMTILSDHEAGIRQIRATLARIGQGTSIIGDLSDVTITAVTNDEVLQYTGAVWENQTLAEAGIAADVHTHLEVDVTDLDHDHPDGDHDHGGLAGLGDDDHTIYLLIDGTRAMSGDLDVGGNDIVMGAAGTQGTLVMPYADTDKYSSGEEGYRLIVSTSENWAVQADIGSGFVNRLQLQDEGSIVFYEETGTEIGRFTLDGDLRVAGDYVYFGYATATDNYIRIVDAGNYFTFNIGGSEALRLDHNGTTTQFDLYGTGVSHIRKLEGTSLRIENEVANQDIYLRTDNGSGLQTRIFIDGSADVMGFYDHDFGLAAEILDPEENLKLYANSAGHIAINFNLERAWTVEQASTGASTAIRFESTTNKSLEIFDTSNGEMITFAWDTFQAPGMDRFSNATPGSVRLDSGNNYEMYQHTSSRRYKTRIRDLTVEHAWDILDDLRPVTYKGNRGDGFYIGLVAEEVAETQEKIKDGPHQTLELVALDEEGLPNSISEEQFVPAIMVALEDLKRQVKELQEAAA